MDAKRPWWHDLVAGLSTDRITGNLPGAIPPNGRQTLSVDPRPPVEQSPVVSSTGGFISRNVVVWDPGSPAREWVRKATHDGRAIAIRREQDARAGRGAHVLGITPLTERPVSHRASLAPDPPRLGWEPPRRTTAASHETSLVRPTALVNHAGDEAQRRCAASLPSQMAAPPSVGLSQPLAPEPPEAQPAQPTAQPSVGCPSGLPPTADRSLELNRGEATLVAHGPLPSEGTVTIYGAASAVTSVTFPTLAPGSGVHAASQRRAGLSAAPPVDCALPSDRPGARPFKGKGAKHASLCAGPWASALLHLPPLPLTGAKRARAGLADIALTSEEVDRVRRERAACALTSILPWAAAGFILGDSAEMVLSRPVEETTRRLVRALSAYGVSSVEAAHSALGRLMSWVVTHHPAAHVVEGSHVSDFLDHAPPSASTLAALAWLRDHCGLAIPARGPVCRPYRCRPPTTTRSKESLTLGAIVGLEAISKHHPSALVRGQAAGWGLLARLALRVEQAQSCVLNAIVQHEFGGRVFTVLVGAVQRDKHPDPSKRRPRPVWGVVDGLDTPGGILDPLQEMLQGVESSRFLIRDTDSPDGDPTRASAWVAAPLRGAPRVDASLQALLQLPPISLSPIEAARHHGHSAKRFLLNVAEASGAFSSLEAGEVGRFSSSTAQSQDLEPMAALLRAHTLRASVLPDIYAGKAKVARVFDLLAKAHLALEGARAVLARDQTVPGTGDASWSSSGPFAGRRAILCLAQQTTPTALVAGMSEG